MLDYVMLQHIPGTRLRAGIDRCVSCGQGTVMAGDGFLMNRCLNCGQYQHATDVVGWNWRYLWKKCCEFLRAMTRVFAKAPSSQHPTNPSLSAEEGMK